MIPCIAAYVQFIGNNPESGRVGFQMVELYLNPRYCLDELAVLVRNLPQVTRVALYDDDMVLPFATWDVVTRGDDLARHFLEILSRDGASD